MDWAAREFGFDWHEHEATTTSAVRALIAALAGIARPHGMRLKICSQKAFLNLGITEEARCVDAERLDKISGAPLADRIERRGTRKECACFPSKHIPEDDTFP